jgi:hypothetical protein
MDTCSSLKRQKIEPEPKSIKEIVAPKPHYKPKTQTAQKLYDQVHYTPVTALELY